MAFGSISSLSSLTHVWRAATRRLRNASTTRRSHPASALRSRRATFETLEDRMLLSVTSATDDIGVYRADTRWFLDTNESATWDGTLNGDQLLSFGVPGDRPIVGDWNGDGTDDIGVHRGDSIWLLDANGNGTWDGTAGGDLRYQFGAAGDIPIAGDWNGDGRDEIGVYRADTNWYLDANGNGTWDGELGGDVLVTFGAVDDTPIVGDWNDDGQDDIGVYREDTRWFLDANGNRHWDGESGGDVVVQFGAMGDVPVVGDWNGDGTDDIGVRRGDDFFLDKNGDRTWSVAAGDVVMAGFGAINDTPLVGRWSTPVTATGDGLTPIARWDVVPYQRIDQGETFKAGVVAFSKDGIDHITFRIGNGAPVNANAMTYNDRTDVYEYWFRIVADHVTTAGPIDVHATVVGKDGGVRELEPLRLIVNSDGSLPQPEVWVDATIGDDSSGVVNDANEPFATIGAAGNALRVWRNSNGNGDNADGGIIHLNPGMHEWQSGGYAKTPGVSEWVTITTNGIGNKENTKIVSKYNAALELVRIKGVTLEYTGGYGIITGTSNLNGTVWLDDVKVIGSNRHVGGSIAVGNNIKKAYYTDSYITNVAFATPRGIFARGLTIKTIGDDAFQNVPMIVNSTADDIDPGSTGWHADAVQFYDAINDDNVIIYNYVATNLMYQGLFWRGDQVDSANTSGTAIVNFVALPAPGAVGGSAIYRSMDQLLIWHSVFRIKGLTLNNEADYKTTLPGLNVVGSEFRQVVNSAGDGVNWTDWRDNHYEITGGITVTPGTRYTTGAPGLDANAYPTEDSPLLDRVRDLVIPADAGNNPRSSPSDVGAIEHPN